MVKYVIQRLIAAFFTFVVILIVVFFVLHSMPGDIIDFSPKLDPAIREMIMDKYHLNDSLIEQFQYTMADYLHFDFGYSLKVRPGVPVFQCVLFCGLFYFAVWTVLWNYNGNQKRYDLRSYRGKFCHSADLSSILCTCGSDAVLLRL